MTTDSHLLQVLLVDAVPRLLVKRQLSYLTSMTERLTLIVHIVTVCVVYYLSAPWVVFELFADWSVFDRIAYWLVYYGIVLVLYSAVVVDLLVFDFLV